MISVARRRAPGSEVVNSIVAANMPPIDDSPERNPEPRPVPRRKAIVSRQFGCHPRSMISAAANITIDTAVRSGASGSVARHHTPSGTATA